MADVDLTEYKGGRLLGSCVAILSLSWASVFLRCYVRMFLTGGFQLDDWLMIAGMVCLMDMPRGGQCILVVSVVCKSVGADHSSSSSLWFAPLYSWASRAGWDGTTPPSRKTMRQQP